MSSPVKIDGSGVNFHSVHACVEESGEKCAGKLTDPCEICARCRGRTTPILSLIHI